MKGSTLLKVTGILSIIGGAISVIVAIIALAAATGFALLGVPGIYVFACILLVLAAAAELVAGIVGVANSSKPYKAGACIAWGIIAIALSVIGNIITACCPGVDVSVVSIILGLALPVLYLIGAFQLKSNAAYTAEAPTAAPNDQQTL